MKEKDGERQLPKTSRRALATVRAAQKRYDDALYKTLMAAEDLRLALGKAHTQVVHDRKGARA